MIQQTKGKIFLADQRGVTETPGYRCRQTFNAGNYFNDHKQPFGELFALNDYTLTGNGAVKITAKETGFMVLLPVAGAIQCKTGSGIDTLVAAGQVQVIPCEKNDTIEVTNPFSEDFVQFLQIVIRVKKTTGLPAFMIDTYNDVNEQLNQLVVVTGESAAIKTPFGLMLGKFSGRGEMVFLPKNKTAGIFTFVIEGAFEVEGRLLHAGDGLALWETGAAEMEALSNDAIVMVIELASV